MYISYKKTTTLINQDHLLVPRARGYYNGSPVSTSPDAFVVPPLCFFKISTNLTTKCTYLLTCPRREAIQHFHFPWRYATETSSITLHIIQYITATHRYNNSCTFRITVHKDIQHSQCLTLNMWGRVQMTKKYIYNGTKKLNR